MNRTKRSGWAAVVLGLAGAWGLRAETVETPTLEALDQKVRILERKLELAGEAEAAKVKETPLLAAGKDGFVLSSADKAFQLKLRGYAQADGRFFLDDSAGQAVDTFVLRRARTIFEGKLGERLEFRLAPDFGNGKAELQDAYLDCLLFPGLRARLGRTKVPLGLERLQSSADTLFVEPGLPTALTPNYDAGLLLQGVAQGGAADYAVGAVNGGPDGASLDVDANDGKDLVARVFLTPWKGAQAAAWNGLSFGLAGTLGRQQGSDTAPGLPALRTAGQQTFFSYRTSTNRADTAFASGDRVRLSPQLYWALGSLGVLAEFVLCEQEVASGKGADTIRNQAWQVAASYVLTGERPSLKGVEPRRALDPSKGQWGALELAARAGELTVDAAAFDGGFASRQTAAESAQSWGLGCTWYLTRNAKLQADYEHTAFTGGAAAGDRADEQAVLTRLQMAW